MKKSLLTAIAALGLMGTAQADIVCKDCDYIFGGRYLRDYWPGDRATFGNRDIVFDLFLQLGDGHNLGFNDWWVFDLNDAATVTLTIANRGFAASPPWGVEIYTDTGSDCGPNTCVINYAFLDTTPIVSEEATSKRWQKTLTLVPGRYLVRLFAGTPATGEASYTATMVVKAAP